MRVDLRHSAKMMIALGTVYVVWGSSFLFTKIAVSALPPALFSAIRFMSAGMVLAAVARLWKKDRLPSLQVEWRHVAVAGFFMVFVSNGLNTWAMRFLPSNQSALLNGTSAFWIAGLGVFGKRGHPLTPLAMLGMGIGFFGVALMLIPKGPLGAHSYVAEGAVLLGCLSWALGTLYYRSIDTTQSSLMFMALQMFLGGAMLLAVALAHGDATRFAPHGTGLLALIYLTFMSSCLAYTAYGWLSLNASPALLGTYGYVAPAIASYLGWQFLHEHLSAMQLTGMVIIIAGVGILTLPGGSLTDPKTLAEPKSP